MIAQQVVFSAFDNHTCFFLCFWSLPCHGDHRVYAGDLGFISFVFTLRCISFVRSAIHLKYLAVDAPQQWEKT